MGKSIGTGYRVWSALEADPELLDAPIRPLVEALNRTGWARTIFSCAGHPEEPDSIKKGRRQAHIDLLVNDLPTWQKFVAQVKHTARGVRVTEGSLGAVPTWLDTKDAWHYRRLVFEPSPYDMPPHTCRQTLDSALASALTALQESAP